jgi:hypothetical protein
MIEGALIGDPDPRRRVMLEFDVRSRAYTGIRWNYRVDAIVPTAVNGISLPARPGESGVGDPFSFPLQSVESLESLPPWRATAAANMA